MKVVSLVPRLCEMVKLVKETFACHENLRLTLRGCRIKHAPNAQKATKPTIITNKYVSVSCIEVMPSGHPTHVSL